MQRQRNSHEQGHQEYRVRCSAFRLASAAPAATHAQTKAQGNGKVIEEIVARVNNEIITLSDYEKAQAQLHEEVDHDCSDLHSRSQGSMYAERTEESAAR